MFSPVAPVSTFDGVKWQTSIFTMLRILFLAYFYLFPPFHSRLFQQAIFIPCPLWYSLEKIPLIPLRGMFLSSSK